MAPDVTGDWEMTAQTPIGDFKFTMKLAWERDQLVGVIIGLNGREMPLNDLLLSGQTLTFTADAVYEGASYHLIYRGTVEGDQIRGTFEANGQSMSWSARRLSAASLAQGT